jgi:hypothetical protein
LALVCDSHFASFSSISWQSISFTFFCYFFIILCLFIL